MKVKILRFNLQAQRYYKLLSLRCFFKLHGELPNYSTSMQAMQASFTANFHLEVYDFANPTDDDRSCLYLPARHGYRVQ